MNEGDSARHERKEQAISALAQIQQEDKLNLHRQMFAAGEAAYVAAIAAGLSEEQAKRAELKAQNQKVYDLTHQLDAFKPAFSYSIAKWKRLREDVFDRDQWRCQCCITRQADVIDHIVPWLRGGEPFDMDNLTSLCRWCHASKTARYDGACGNAVKNVFTPAVVPTVIGLWFETWKDHSRRPLPIIVKPPFGQKPPNLRPYKLDPVRLVIMHNAGLRFVSKETGNGHLRRAVVTTEPASIYELRVGRGWKKKDTDGTMKATRAMEEAERKAIYLNSVAGVVHQWTRYV